MPEILRLLQEIASAQTLDELAAIASVAGEIDERFYGKEAIASVIDALREARERLELAP